MTEKVFGCEVIEGGLIAEDTVRICTTKRTVKVDKANGTVVWIFPEIGKKLTVEATVIDDGNTQSIEDFTAEWSDL